MERPGLPRLAHRHTGRGSSQQRRMEPSVLRLILNEYFSPVMMVLNLNPTWDATGNLMEILEGGRVVSESALFMNIILNKTQNNIGKLKICADIQVFPDTSNTTAALRSMSRRRLEYLRDTRFFFVIVFIDILTQKSEPNMKFAPVIIGNKPSWSQAMISTPTMIFNRIPENQKMLYYMTLMLTLQGSTDAAS